MSELLITGVGGHLGSVMLATALAQGRDVVGSVSPLGPRPLVGPAVAVDLCRHDSVAQWVRAERPKVIVHLAAITTVAGALREPVTAHEVNVEATAHLIDLADEVGAGFVLASTDMVFDGLEAPYAEDATPNPLSVYGRTKLAAEAHVQTYSRGTVARLPLLYGVPQVHRTGSFFRAMVQGIVQGDCLPLFCDEFRVPLSYGDGAVGLLKLADHELGGIVHLPGADRLSRLQFGRLVARALGLSTDLPSTRSADSDSAGLGARPPDLTLTAARYLSAFGQPPGRPTEVVLAELAPALPGWVAGPSVSGR